MSDTHLMQAFFDATDTFFYIKDAGGHFLLVNRVGAVALGMTEEECVGKTAYDFLPRDQADRTSAVDMEVRETGQPKTFKDVVSLPNGDRTLVDRKFPVPLAEYPGATGGVVLDITDVE